MTRFILVQLTPKLNRWWRWLGLGLLTLALVLGQGYWASPSAAQLAQFPNPLGNGASSPPLGVLRVGVLEAAAVSLDGNDLFDVASPVVFNRNEPGELVPIEVRARQIEVNLHQVVNQALHTLSPDSALGEADTVSIVEVNIEQINGLPVLFAVLDGLSEPRVLLTVTDGDAQFNGMSKMALAESWQDILEVALQRAIDNRQPHFVQRQLRRALLLFAIGVVLTLILTTVWKILGWRKHTLEQQQSSGEHNAVTPDISTHDPLVSPRVTLVSLLRYQVSLEQRLQVIAFLHWLVFWGIAFVWISTLAGIMYLFPQTRGYASRLFSTPVLLIVAWFITGLINRLANIGIDRVSQAWEKNDLANLDNIQQRAMRISTITRAAKGFKTAAIYVLALLLLLQLLRLAPASLLAFGAVAALAISFAAQNLVKDLVNGLLILLEDQYAIGDLISTGTATGIVENLNLRITQIRGEDGRLVTLPNSLIAQVDNLSRNWSRATLKVDVAYGTNVDRALAVVRQTAHAMAEDPNWGYAILDPTEMIGVESMTHAGITLLLWIRTRPLNQFVVAREFRRRLRLAFDQEEIGIGIPQQVLTGAGRELWPPLRVVSPTAPED